MISSEKLLDSYNNHDKMVKEERLKAFYQYAGFNEAGMTYIPVSPDEQTVDKLRQMYCPYNKGLGFHSPKPLEGIEMAIVNGKDVVKYDSIWERYRIDLIQAKNVLSNIYRLNLTNKDIGSGFRGEEGKTINIRVKFEKSYLLPCDSDFGDLLIFYFIDDEGYRYSWLQRNYDEKTIRKFIKHHSKAGYLSITAKVKKHETIRAVKYTRLTRCMISGDDTTTLAHYASWIRNNKRSKNEKKEKEIAQ